MTFSRLSVASAFLFLSPCLAQAGGDGSPMLALKSFLNAAHISGSLEFRGRCGPHGPKLPPIPTLDDYSGPPLEVLQKMFAGDPQVRITEEPGGMVRIAEAGVPTDLLDFQIHRLVFGGGNPGSSHGPGVALLTILGNPQVRGFRRAHNIGPNPDSFPEPGDAFSGKLIVFGVFDDITVSQALDHVLKTFPGFWLYGDCTNAAGERIVYFNLVESSWRGSKQP